MKDTLPGRKRAKMLISLRSNNQLTDKLFDAFEKGEPISLFGNNWYVTEGKLESGLFTLASTGKPVASEWSDIAWIEAKVEEQS